jgi:histidine triad (HIT) family protein
MSTSENKYCCPCKDPQFTRFLFEDDVCKCNCHKDTPETMEERSDCVFCGKDKIKSNIFEVGGCYIFEPLNPVVPGHLLVVPKTHITDFAVQDLMAAETFKVASYWVREHLKGDYNLITSKGKSATQSVMHFHIHLVPRQDGDGLLLPWTGKEAISSHNKELVEKMNDFSVGNWLEHDYGADGQEDFDLAEALQSRFINLIKDSK